MEMEYLVTAFEKNFGSSSDVKTAIYGISNNTKIILKQFSDYNIVGLMDGYLKQGSMYDYPIITLEDVLAQSVERIIIVARAASVKIILNRIREFCKQNTIQVYDVNGADLLKKYEMFQCTDMFSETYDDLINVIERNEIISFDIFDTILMRKTLFPTDVFRLIEQRMELGFSYAQERQRAEQEMLDGPYPTLDAIYDRLQKNVLMDDEAKENLKRIEVETEKEVIIPRDTIKAAYDYAIKKGKKVYFVSDMYLSKKHLKDLLEGLGVTVYEDILVSSEYGKMKTGGLFDVLLDRIGNSSCVHIGDNEVSDIASAREAGLNTFHVMSAYQLLLHSSFARITAYEDDLESRMSIGLVISRIFNNPFELYNTGGIPVIKNSSDFSYAFVGPIVTSYLYWLQSKLKTQNYDGVLFFARDGYLLQKLYSTTECEKKVPSKYFLISRFPAIVCNLHTEEDIVKVIDAGYDGTPQEFLQNRFLLPEEEIKPMDSERDVKRYVLDHASIILKRAGELRKAYVQYMSDLGIKEQERYAVVDLAASGTCQLSFEKLSRTRCQGYYFVHIEDASKEIDVESMFRISTWFCKEAYICESYVLLESILTSFRPSLKYLKNDGSPVFCEETRNELQLEDLKELQNGITNFFQDYSGLSAGQGIAPAVGDMFLSFVQKDRSNCEGLNFLKGELVDEFFHRSYQFSDIIA